MLRRRAKTTLAVGVQFAAASFPFLREFILAHFCLVERRIDRLADVLCAQVFEHVRVNSGQLGFRPFGLQTNAPLQAAANSLRHSLALFVCAPRLTHPLWLDLVALSSQREATAAA